MSQGPSDAPPLKERECYHIPVSIMAQVTYRGVKYDTEEYHNRPTTTKSIREVYRGVTHTENVERKQEVK